MARKQSRRSISVKGLTYQRLKNRCERNGESISGYVERLVSERMDAAGEPIPEKVDPPKLKPQTPEEIDRSASNHFTF